MTKFEQGKAEHQQKFIELRAQGLSLRECARQLSRSVTTLSNWQRELEAEIARLKAVELEALYAQYHLLKQNRIELLGEQITALKDELRERKLSDIDTERLLELLLRYYDKAREEFVEPIFASDDDVARLSGKNSTKLDNDAIMWEISTLLARYRAGLVDERQAMRELPVLREALKAFEQHELLEKVEKLTSLRYCQKFHEKQ